MNVGRRCGAGRSCRNNRRAIPRSAEVETRILAGDHVEGTPRGHFHERCEGEVAQEAVPGVSIGNLGIYGVKRYRHAEDACGEASGGSESLLNGKAAREQSRRRSTWT